MRRHRNRFYTIDAENEVEFMKELDNMKKSKLSLLNFEEKEDEQKIQEMDEEDTLSPRKNRKSIHFNDENEGGEYSGLGALRDSLDDDEDNLGADYVDDDIIKESEEDINKNDNNEEKGLEILCYYLKNSVTEQSKGKISNNSERIFYNDKNCVGALSVNAIYDLNIIDLVDNILADNDNEYSKPKEGNNNSLRDYILQNIESDSNLKIMIMSNNKSTKNSFINKFFEDKNNIEKNKEEITDDPFEIRKKQVKLFNKNITLQIFDTSDEFHKNSISTIYYKTVNAFFIFIESSSHNVHNYLDFISEKLNKYIVNKTCVIFGINMLFKKDCTIDGDNLREYAMDKNMMFIPIKINDFDLKNNIIVNLLNLILIKGIDNKMSKLSLRKGSKEKGLGKVKNKLTDKINNSTSKKNIYDITKMNIQSCLGYKKKYRIKHINAFDMEDDTPQKIKRKISADI